MDQQGCGQDEFHIVAIGASAGGLEALDSLFDALPDSTGLSFVVVQHLSPDFKSHMRELLSRRTRMPIYRVENGMRVQRDCVYLIPPKMEMVISDGQLLLTEKSADRTLSHPIDQFFRSLALDAGTHAVGVILSGTGSDGSRGIRNIHEAGGLVIVQDEATAKFDGMPLNAQATGMADLILSPQGIAEALVRFVHEGLSRESLRDHELLATIDGGIDRVFRLLNRQHGIDFAHYKASTVGRRIQRRIDMQKLDSIDQYVAYLEANPNEVNDLYKDLLIGVTKFFRDPEAFSVLEREVIPHMLARLVGREPIRIWVAGCATGEEAYSIAMLLDEEISRRRSDVPVKIFSTDAHHGSLNVAAQGIYPEGALSELTEDRKSRYFRRHRDGFHITKELRQYIVFAPHNLISDAPFTQMDLVSCRNLLIYLQPTAQKKVLSMFHFALKTGGTLWLGPSESPGEFTDEFQTVDKRWRVYRKRRDVRLPLEPRLPFGAPVAITTAPVTLPKSRRPTIDHSLLGTYDRLLDRKMPPSFLVNEQHEILHIFGGAERFIRPRGGRPSNKLTDLIDDPLKTSLTGALHHALRKQDIVRYTGIPHVADGDSSSLRLMVEPIHDPASHDTRLLVEIHDLEDGPRPVKQHDTTVDMDQLTKERVSSLESELRFAQENLQATIEEMETSNEELQATNEELVASNEELQSTNEELHSVNEELYTVNAEHQRRLDELAEANDDMDNLLATTRVGVIFLDDELFIRRFTPEIARLFNLVQQDVGRSIEGFAHQLKYDRLVDDLRDVLNQRREKETYLEDRHGTPFLMRMLPYRAGTHIAGVVMTLIDVRSLREAQKSLERFKYMTDSSPDLLSLVNRDGRFIYANPRHEQVLGYTADELLEMQLFDLDPGFTRQRVEEWFALPEGERVPSFETTVRCKDGELLPVEANLSRVVFESTHFLACNLRDITEKKVTHLDLEAAIAEARKANQAKSEFLANVSHELRTPMTAVLGFAEILKAELQDPEHREKVDIIKRNGEYLLALLNDILDLSKIEAGKLSVQHEAVDVNKVLEDVRSLMSVRATQEGIPLAFDVEQDVPRQITADHIRVRQILVNLISNAIKFTDEGEVRVHVAADRSRSPATLNFAVTDTGIGMSQQQQRELFKPFTQASNQMARKFGGTGLGLSISKRLAASMGGEILVTSQPNRGSCFTLSLPVTDQQLTRFAAALPAQSEKTDEKPPIELTGRVLLADDRRDVWRVARYFLESAGAKVTIAEDGRQAVDAVMRAEKDETRFDLILMDMQMPIMTGRDAVIELRKRGINTPIIALTADAMTGDRETCIQFGCDDYLPKPIDGRKLLEIVDNLLRRSS